MPEWLLWSEHFIQSVGFPIFVSCFLLAAWWKLWKQMLGTLEGLKQSIDGLVKLLQE